MIENQVTERIIGAAIEVHRALGPGLLESVYGECLAVELELCGLRYESQRPVPIIYKERMVGTELRIDFMVEECVVVELKAIEKILAIHQAQLLTYLRLTNRQVGLLINFNVPVLHAGIRRLVNQYRGLRASASPR
ncbi:MAG: GxxExxY protein [Candidatus Binatia bacterium]